ncbi:MAG: outer membrane beta-barrel protein [Tannerella sp.]|jgi:hypothetical protein|nr:outer membrane beta-barrel protein [Tannerella sp.]
MKKYLLLIPFIFCYSIAFSQENNLAGRVLDSLTNEPLEYATVVLYTGSDSLFIAGAVTDESGAFSLTKVAVHENYIIEVKCMGFQTKAIHTGSISSLKDDFEITLSIDSIDDILLDEVIVESTRYRISLKADKKVLNIDKTISSAGEMAADVLLLIPEIRSEGNRITLKGQSFTVMVNGKYSSLTPDELFLIQASDIDKIEIITNPSVRYNPAGTGGIINLIYKNKKPGLNGVIQGFAGTDNYYNGSVTLNYGTEKINTFVNFYPRGYHHLKMDGFMITHDLTTDVISHENSIGRSDFYNHILKIGFDYAISDNDVLTVFYSGMVRDGKYNNVISFFNNRDIAPESALTERTFSDYGSRENDASLNYKHNFKRPDTELSVDFFYSKGKEDNMRDFETKDQLFYTLDLPVDNRNMNLETNLKIPVWQKINLLLDAGYNFYITDVSSDYNFIMQNITPSHSNFHYKEGIHSLYVQPGLSIGSFDFVLGSRYENYTARYHGLKNNKNDFFQSVGISYTINSTNRLGFNYSNRVGRPNVYNLNPTSVVRDYLSEMTVGNVNLRPYYSHSTEMNYSFSGNKISVNTSLSYLQSDDMIDNVFYMEEGVKYRTHGNVLDLKQYYLSSAVNWQSSVFSLNVSGSVYKETLKTKGEETVNNPWNYDARIMPSLKLKNDIQMNFQFMYYSPFKRSYLRRTSSIGSVFTASKTFKDRLTISIKANNIIEKLPGEYARGENFNSESYVDYHRRAVYLGIIYRFGKNFNTRGKTNINTGELNIRR